MNRGCSSHALSLAPALVLLRQHEARHIWLPRRQGRGRGLGVELGQRLTDGPQRRGERILLPGKLLVGAGGAEISARNANWEWISTGCRMFHSHKRTDSTAMNALIFVIVLLFGNADISPAGVAVVWTFLVFVEWLADRFAGWLWLRWAEHWLALGMHAGQKRTEPVNGDAGLGSYPRCRQAGSSAPPAE